MMRTLVFGLAFFGFSLASHATTKQDVIEKLGTMRECCIQDVSFDVYENYVFATVNGREMGHDYCDAHFVFVSKDYGASFQKFEIAGADQCYHYATVAFASKNKTLMVRQYRKCFYSSDFGKSFVEAPCPR